MQSRVNSTRLLFSKLASTKNPCEVVISASATGFYGTDTGDAWVDEESPSGSGFLAEVVRQWERQITRFEELKLRVVTLRTGIVLSNGGGALPLMAKPVKMNVGAVLGAGTQYMSWIHIDDLCQILLRAIQDSSFRGIFNAVAPNPVTNREFTHTLAEVLNKPLWLPSVPAWALKLTLGEMSRIVLGGNRVSAEKLKKHGYEFSFAVLKPALVEILN
jgi:uncharacterized protein (TIGR01777 family)